jgi:uridine kinase
MLVIFIAGASGSGKTKLSNFIAKNFDTFSIQTSKIKLDDYYKEIPDGMNLEYYKKTTNFDAPDCLDFSLLAQHILHLLKGKSIKKPIFDFKVERRTGEESVAPPTVLIIEGTASLFFAQQWINHTLPSYKIFIDVHQETLLNRRITRDIDERGYADEASILKKDADYVRPTFLNFISPTRRFADEIIENHKEHKASTALHPLEVSANKIVSAMLARVCS